MQTHQSVIFLQFIPLIRSNYVYSVTELFIGDERLQIMKIKQGNSNNDQHQTQIRPVYRLVSTPSRSLQRGLPDLRCPLSL